MMTVVLKHAKDGLLFKALDARNVHEIMGCSQSARKGCPHFSTWWWHWETSFYWPQEYTENTHDLCQLLPGKWNPTDNWTAVTKKKDFDDFRCSQVATEKMDAFSSPTFASAPVPKQKDLLADFKKGIKRDASLFMVLKDPKQWNSWYVQAQAQIWCA